MIKHEKSPPKNLSPKCTSVPPGWICDNLVKHVYMNRFIAWLDFVVPKTKPLEVVKLRNFIIIIWDQYKSKHTKSAILITNMNEFLWYLIKQKSYEYFYFIFNHNFLFFSTYNENSFIFVISMVDLVGIDVYMSKIMIMKFRNLTTSNGLVLGTTRSSQAINLFI